MERFYTLIDRNKHTHYGFVIDDDHLARKWADIIEASEEGAAIDIYEFIPSEELGDKPTVTLTTYGEYDEKRDIQYGKDFTVYADWLIEHLPECYATLSEFMDEYIWDISLIIYNEAVADGAIVNERG